MPTRMLRLSIATGLIILLAAAGATAQSLVVVPFDLGAEELMISPVEHFEQPFDLSGIGAAAGNVQLHLVGSHTTQFAYCPPNPSYNVYALESRISFCLLVGETVFYRTTQTFPSIPAGQAIDLVLAFDTGATPDWSFLAEGGGTLLIEHENIPGQCSSYYGYAFYAGIDVTLTAVELLIDTTGGVPNEPTAWGMLKALYRNP
jgi:hypothetical protein